MWLRRLGADLHGFALEPPTKPNLYQAAQLDRLLASDSRADVASIDELCDAMANAKPDVVFHLAAQPLVRAGYSQPIDTIRTNTLGTAHVLEATRHTPTVRAAVVVSTDKVYAARHDEAPHQEDDGLGGEDPYSASKAAAEVILASYRTSYFLGRDGHPARIASARAGNVIGGGDWASDRLVPDCIRAFEAGRSVVLRYPDSVRPWQHVLEPIHGYIKLAEHLLGPSGERYATAWNFGPDSDVTVFEVARLLATMWGDGASVQTDGSAHPAEAPVLRLDASRSKASLAWQPRWSLDQAVEATLDWHRAYAAEADMLETSMDQIRRFESASGANHD
jgi:CDP-glucose 4,6-dehydratase